MIRQKHALRDQVGRYKVLLCSSSFLLTNAPSPMKLKRFSDFRHSGGAIYQFSGDSDVNFQHTKISRISPPGSKKVSNIRQKIKRLNQNVQCRTLQALAIIRTHHKSSLSLPKIRRPQVICQSRTHSSAIISRSCFFIVFGAIFTKSKSPVKYASPALANQPRIGKIARATPLQRQSCPNPLN